MRFFLVASILLFIHQLNELLANDGLVAAAEVKLPSIWPLISGDKSYHILYNIEMLNQRETLNVEEWADLGRQLFRLDVISSESRITFLSNGNTGQMIYYQPFVCGPVIKTSKEYECLATLFRGYLMNDQKPDAISYGLGPLWIIAERDSTKVSQLRMINPTLKDKYDFLKDFTGYKVELPATQFGGNDTYQSVNFYFPPGEKEFVDHLEWVLDQDSKRVVEVRAKLTSIDTNKLLTNIFELPIGYGCPAQKDDDSLDELISPNHFLIHEGPPEQLDLEITASKPVDDLMYAWDSNKYSTKLIRGQIESGSSEVPKVYYSTLTQARDYKTSRIKRQKKLWAAKSNFDQASVYTIEETFGRQTCKVEQVNAHDYVRFTFPGQELELKPMSISLGTLANLYSTYPGFAKISSGEVLAPGKFKNAIYEKRFESYVFNDDDGQIVWSGPVSVVKQLSTYNSYLDDLSNNGATKLSIDNDYHTTMILLLYSKDSKILLYKVTVDIVGKHSLSMPTFMSYLELTPCVPADKTEALVLKYPIKDLSRISELETNRVSILSIFTRDLLQKTPIMPLQLNSLELTFDNFYAYLRMNILDLSAYQTFDLLSERRLIAGSDPTALTETTTSSLAKCSTLCDYYGCYKLSFEPEELRCRLELKNGKAQISNQANAVLYTYRKPDLKALHPAVADFFKMEEDSETGRHHLGPRQIEELFQLVLEDSSTREKDNLLSLKYYTGEPENDLILTPISQHSDIDSLRELVKRDEGDDAPEAGELAVLGTEGVELQYKLALENRQFTSDDSQVKEIEAASYENCAQACENDGECKTFSYCRSTYSCSITRKLSRSRELAKKTSTATGCHVYTLDELSKFEDFGLALRPTEVTKGPERVDMPRDCASHCLDDTQINCQGFYSCPSKVKGFRYDCLFTDKHISNDFNKHRPQFISKGKRMTLQEAARKVLKQECRFYSRSYLAQFDQYHSKTIEFPSQDLEQTRVVLRGVNAEKCARRCIEHECLAFDVCVESNSRYFNQACQMAVKEIRHSHLASKAGCTTFALSDRSQFRKYGAYGNETKQQQQQQNFDGERPDREALGSDDLGSAVVLDPEELKAEEQDVNSNVFNYLRRKFTHVRQSVDGSHWLARLLCLIIGLMIGAGGLTCVNEIYARQSRQRIQ